ncbi:hypothetical protein MUP77_11355 [Candidatus Bathyarchaeota archaeon]|nr:hypothetical protein [Candidatus Bathyarchaeota archaeon]
MSVVDPRLTVECLTTIILVLGAWTILWKDNPYSQLCSHWLIGASIGNLTLVAIENLQNQSQLMVGGQIVLIIPLILGALIFSRYNKKIFWIARYPISLMVGFSVGLMMRG